MEMRPRSILLLSENLALSTPRPGRGRGRDSPSSYGMPREMPWWPGLGGRVLFCFCSYGTL